MKHALKKIFTLAMLSAVGAAPAAAGGIAAPFSAPWRTALVGSAVFGVVDGAPAANAPKQDGAVLGVYRSGKEFLVWRQGDSDLASQTLRDTLKDPAVQGIRRLDQMIAGAPAGTWIVLNHRTAGDPIYLLKSAEGVTSVSVDRITLAGEGKDAVQLPLTMRRAGEGLIIQYGSPALGTVILSRPDNAAIARNKADEDKLTPLATLYYDTRGAQPKFTGAWLESGGAALDELFARADFADLPAVKAFKNNPAALTRIAAEMEKGGIFWVDFVVGGDLDFTLYPKGAKEGKPYLYTFDGQVVDAR